MERAIPDSVFTSKLKRFATDIIEPVKKDPNGIVYAYSQEKGKVTIGDLKRELEKIAGEIKNTAQRQVRESLNIDEDMLCEAFWNKWWDRVWDTVSFAGKTIKWIAEKLIAALRMVARSWFGSHPVGRLAMAIMIASFGASRYMYFLRKLMGKNLPVYIPASIISFLALWIITDTINAMSHLNSSQTIEEFVSPPPKKDRLTIWQYFKGIMGFRK